ncbi:MAG: DUF861 domain-containing protein [Planctomycetes bacterium]|nr:DUF861 domain-containing protein [Planctomycetota bacterium]
MSDRFGCDKLVSTTDITERQTSARKPMTTAIQKAEPISTLPDMPIEPSWIKGGNPVARGMIATQSGDKRVSSGMWSCEPGTFEWTFAWDEFVHVLEGEVDIVEDGTESVLTLRAGDLAHFPLGMKTHWHVKQPVRKFFVIRTPEPLEL